MLKETINSAVDGTGVETLISFGDETVALNNNKMSSDMGSRLLVSAEKTPEWSYDPKYAKTKAPVSCYRYFVIHKLREGEKYQEGELSQFVTAVDKDWIAKDICDKYNKHSEFTGYRLVYEMVYVERN